MKMTAEIKTDQRRVIDSPSRADVRNPVDRGEREVMVEAVELAGAVIVAIAVTGGLACDQPIDVCHGVLPSHITDRQR